MTLAYTTVASPNFGYPRGERTRNGRRVVAFVIHRMQGTLAGTRAWFLNPASAASSNWGVAQDGRVERYVPPECAPWTNGDVQGPDRALPWLAAALDAGINPNEVTETIECEGYEGEPWPEAQYGALLALLRERCAARGLAPGPQTIVGHYRINSVTRAGCPGRNFPWDRLFADLAGPPGRSALLRAAYATLPLYIAGLPLYEATADLGEYDLDRAARCLVCEKSVLWTDGVRIDAFHRGQYERLAGAGKVREEKR
jgi:hypothetical protein